MKKTLRILTFNHVVLIVAVVILESQISGYGHVGIEQAAVFAMIYGMAIFPAQLLIELIFVVWLAFLVMFRADGQVSYYAWSACLASGGFAAWYALI